MCQVNMFKAKTDLSKLVAMLEKGEEDEVIIARNGVPVAKMVKYVEEPAPSLLGIAKNDPEFMAFCQELDENWDELKKEVADMMLNSKIFPDED